MLPWLYIVLFLDSSVFLSLPICILFSIYLPLSVVSVYSVYKYLQRLMVLICSAHLVFRLCFFFSGCSRCLASRSFQYIVFHNSPNGAINRQRTGIEGQK